jgi:hypothetical protein
MKDLTEIFADKLLKKGFYPEEKPQWWRHTNSLRQHVIEALRNGPKLPDHSVGNSCDLQAIFDSYLYGKTEDATDLYDAIEGAVMGLFRAFSKGGTSEEDWAVTEATTLINLTIHEIREANCGLL